MSFVTPEAILTMSTVLETQTSWTHPSQRRLSCQRCRQQKIKCQRQSAGVSCVRCAHMRVECRNGIQGRIGRPPAPRSRERRGENTNASEDYDFDALAPANNPPASGGGGETSFGEPDGQLLFGDHLLGITAATLPQSEQLYHPLDGSPLTHVDLLGQSGNVDLDSIVDTLNWGTSGPILTESVIQRSTLAFMAAPQGPPPLPITQTMKVLPVLDQELHEYLKALSTINIDLYS